MEMKIGGYIKSKCAVRVTSGKHSMLKLVNEEDIKDLQAISAIAMIDFVSVPFISSKADVMNLKEALGSTGMGIGLLAKIDTIDAIH